MTEPDVGSHTRAIQSYAEKKGNDYLVTGKKLFNARLSSATHVILFTQSSQQRTGRLTAFLIPIDHPGLQIKTLTAHGLYGNSFGGLEFNRMVIPKSMMIGEEGKGTQIFHNHFLYWRLMQSAAAIGTAKEALNQVVERLRTRQAFGGPIGRFTHLQQALGEHAAKLHAAHLLVAEASRLIDQNRHLEAVPIVAMAKGEGVEWALAATDFAMKTFGASGYSPDFTDLGQRVRDLQGLRIADGTTDIMRSQVVRSLFGEDFWQLSIGENNGLNQRSKSQLPTPNYIFTQLRNASLRQTGVLISQEKYLNLVSIDGGGPCPVIAAAILLQGFAKMTGEKQEILNLDGIVRRLYSNHRELHRGRLSNGQVLKVLKELIDENLSNIEYEIQIDTQKSMWNSEKAVNAKEWSDLDSALIDPKPYELKLLSFTVENGLGETVGRHFVIVKDRFKNSSGDDFISVIDPANPGKDFIYQVSREFFPNSKGSSLKLTTPERIFGSDSYLIVNSIFTVKLTSN